MRATLSQPEITIKMMGGNAYGIPQKESASTTAIIRRAVFDEFHRQNPTIRVINAGGLVTLDVNAEVSTPGTTTDPTLAPPINTRSVQTLLSVPTGQTMVMGGLITENSQNNSAGLPGLARIPILGGLFGTQTLQKDRTELILFITPRVVENEADYRRVIDDLRRKMERLDEVFPRTKTVPEAGSTQ